MPALDLHVATRDSAVEVTVAGDLDMAAAFKLETRVDEVLAEEGVRAVVLDLSHVGFMDSAGLSALVHVRDRADQLDVSLSMSPVSEAVRRILEVTGLDGIAEP